jgi:hypothetical protein
MEKDTITVEKKMDILKLESVLDIAVLLSLIEISAEHEKELLERIKINMDDLTGKENLYPNKYTVRQILSKIDLLRNY